MEPEKQEKLGKIAKLLMLAEDQKGKPEGENARHQASKMMAKYRITESEIDFGSDSNSEIIVEDDGVEGISDQGGRRQWCLDLASMLAYVFDSKHFWREWRGTVHFLGSESDVDTCMYFQEIVMNHINRGAREMWPNDKHWRKRNEFGTAAMSIITDRLYTMKQYMNEQEERLKETEEYAGGYNLVCVKKDLVKSAWEEFAEDMKTKKRKKVEQRDRKTWLAGVQAGKTAPLNHGIENDDTDRIQESHETN